MSFSENPHLIARHIGRALAGGLDAVIVLLDAVRRFRHVVQAVQQRGVQQILAAGVCATPLGIRRAGLRICRVVRVPGTRLRGVRGSGGVRHAGVEDVNIGVEQREERGLIGASKIAIAAAGAGCVAAVSCPA